MKGQASWGAMELLIGVIILSMSMAVVFFAMQNIQQSQCIADIRSQTINLENAILDVALGAPPTQRKVPYSFVQCGGSTLESIRFIYYGDAAFCRRCPYALKGCWIVQPTVYDAKTNRMYPVEDASVCINMPAEIDLQVLDPVLCGQAPLAYDNSKTPWPKYIPGTITPVSGSPSDLQHLGNVIPTVYSGPSSCNDGTSCWTTFSRTSSTPRNLVFRIEKSINPSTSIGVVKICPLPPG
ncbi:hypothetical protein AUJ14_04460 [Candidatus Micrarchaeota archaeon CG1_02_55_22]|nr:MAG: hypothetical protein AUJ14_04460 [Candidatus Micrarchaeota archaeon CG1_02_55_22]